MQIQAFSNPYKIIWRPWLWILGQTVILASKNIVTVSCQNDPAHLNVTVTCIYSPLHL